MYCDAVNEHPVFGQAEKLNLVGYSQGNMIARYIIEMCDLNGKEIHRYISVGGPQQGVGGALPCNGTYAIVCKLINFVANTAMDLRIVENHVAPASYYRDNRTERHYKKYLEEGSFLPYVNNEKNHSKMEEYKQKFSSLDALMLIEFGADSVVIPHASEHFSDFSGRKPIPLN